MIDTCNITDISVFGIKAYTCDIGSSVGKYFIVDKRLAILGVPIFACDIYLASISISEITYFVNNLIL